MTTHTDNVVAIRRAGSEPAEYLYEDDAGECAFGPLCARTYFFEPGEEALYSHMSAAPGGHATVEEAHFVRVLTTLA